MFDYDKAFEDNIKAVQKEGRYRVFADLQRNITSFPQATFFDEEGKEKNVTIWCSNDYLGQGCNPLVVDAICNAVKTSGAGAGGTRNISGNTHYHILLEQELAALHGKDAALLFSSGFVANDAAIATVAKALPNCIIFSDEKNHASMIEGIRHSGAAKHIFRHNDLDHLEQLLKQYPLDTPKLIAFESVYSMDGDFGKIVEIITLAKRYGALTYLDEVHAVGMYGETGAGVAEQLGVANDIDIIQATLGKAFGCMGGYIAANRTLIDMVRSNASGFIFTTSLPPSITAGALASIKDLRGENGKKLRQRHQERAKKLKSMLQNKGLPYIHAPSHIVPVMVGEPDLCRKLSTILLERFGIYIQPINYPTVARGTERLRITATPFHDDHMMEQLVNALDTLWDELAIARSNEATCAA